MVRGIEKRKMVDDERDRQGLVRPNFQESFQFQPAGTSDSPRLAAGAVENPQATTDSDGPTPDRYRSRILFTSYRVLFTSYQE
jgi:hypothetical protein